MTIDLRASLLTLTAYSDNDLTILQFLSEALKSSELQVRFKQSNGQWKYMKTGVDGSTTIEVIYL